MIVTKYKLGIFSAIALVGSAVMPLLNIFVFQQVRLSELSIANQAWEKLFTFDGLEGYRNKKLAGYGLSGNFDQAIIGKEGYLFLGNFYNQSINQHNGSFNEPQILEAVTKTLQAQTDFLTNKGITSLFIIAPDKESIYPEKLPDWYHPSEATFKSSLLSHLQNSAVNIIDLTPILRVNKDKALYFKTDTHWNNYGGYLGYRAVISHLDPNLSAYNATSLEPYERVSGDLTALLKFTLEASDTEYRLENQSVLADMMINICTLESSTFIESDCYHATNTGLPVNERPFVVSSPLALNKKTAVWIRDSFGGANALLYQATFAKIIEVHYDYLRDEEFKQLIEKYSPDYVIYQVVERNLINLR